MCRLWEMAGQYGRVNSFRTQPFVTHFLCVASRVGDILSVHTFVILFRELEWLSLVCDKSNSYIRPATPKTIVSSPDAQPSLGGNAVPRVVSVSILRRGCVRSVSAFIIQRGLHCVDFPTKPHQCCHRSSPATSKQFITKHTVIHTIWRTPLLVTLLSNSHLDTKAFVWSKKPRNHKNSSTFWPSILGGAIDRAYGLWAEHGCSNLSISGN